MPQRMLPKIKHRAMRLRTKLRVRMALSQKLKTMELSLRSTALKLTLLLALSMAPPLSAPVRMAITGTDTPRHVMKMFQLPQQSLVVWLVLPVPSLPLLLSSQHLRSAQSPVLLQEPQEDLSVSHKSKAQHLRLWADLLFETLDLC